MGVNRAGQAVAAKTSPQAPEPAPGTPAAQEAAQVLRASVNWPVEEWRLLSSDRRLFLIQEAVVKHPNVVRESPLLETMIDTLVAAREGPELYEWISHGGTIDPSESQKRRIWDGSRGSKLLSLDTADGFTERGVIALHRGVDRLQRGETREAIMMFAKALAWAGESRVAEQLAALSRRWLAYVTSQYRVDAQLMAVLRATVPRQDFSRVLEDLAWQAALSADKTSYQLCLENQQVAGPSLNG